MAGRGTVLRVNVVADYKEFKGLTKRNNEFKFHVLKSLGRQARRWLQRSHWLKRRSKTTLQYNGVYKNSKGQYKVINRVTKFAQSIVFTSPPMNFFEFGRKFKGKDKERPRLILTGKFKRHLEANAGRYANTGILVALKKLS